VIISKEKNWGLCKKKTQNLQQKILLQTFSLRFEFFPISGLGGRCLWWEKRTHLILKDFLFVVFSIRRFLNFKDF
jgi:hypothetical protein